MSGKLANTTSQPQSQNAPFIQKHIFRSGSGSAGTIGICWLMYNEQFIMYRIRKSNE
jgi:hypothetical protein